MQINTWITPRQRAEVTGASVENNHRVACRSNDLKACLPLQTLYEWLKKGQARLKSSGPFGCKRGIGPIWYPAVLQIAD